MQSLVIFLMTAGMCSGMPRCDSQTEVIRGLKSQVEIQAVIEELKSQVELQTKAMQGLKSQVEIQTDLIEYQVEIQAAVIEIQKKAMHQGLKSQADLIQHHAYLIEYQVEIQAAVIEELKSQVVGIQTKARAT
jgi:hypothetical protein